MLRYLFQLTLASVFVSMHFAVAETKKDNRFLLVNDSYSSFKISDWERGLQSMSRQYKRVEGNQTQKLTLENLLNYRGVIWVTGGQRSDLSYSDVRLLESYLKQRGNLILAGMYSGDGLKWGFVDKWYFGFEYEDTTFRPTIVKPSIGMIDPFQIRTDYGTLIGGKELIGFPSNEDHNSEFAGKSCMVRWRRFPARAVWIGFDLLNHPAFDGAVEVHTDLEGFVGTLQDIFRI